MQSSPAVLEDLWAVNAFPHLIQAINIINGHTAGEGNIQPKIILFAFFFQTVH
jgi:hypothetical protein